MSAQCTVKLCYNRLLGKDRSVISNLGYSRLIRLWIFTVQFRWPADSSQNGLPSPRQWPSVC